MISMISEMGYSHEWLPLLITIFAISASASIFLLLKARARRTAQLPPGPPSWPIIGHLHLLGALPHQSLAKLAHTYGPLMGLRLGGVPAIVASSPDMAREILQTHDVSFAYRPRSAAAVHLCFDCNDVAYAPLGPYWKFMRQVYAAELFSAKKMEEFRHVRKEEVHDLMRAVLQQGKQGRSVVVRPSLVTASNNINCRMVMGKKLEDVHVGGEVDLHSLIKEVLCTLGSFYLGDYVPWLSWLDPNGNLKRMYATGQRVKAMLQAVIDDRRRQQSMVRRDDNDEVERGPRDLLDVLLAASRKNTPDVTITDKHIMATILDVFVGGSSTSATVVEWALAELINHPRVMKKLHEELDNVVGKERLVEESDVPNLTYLNNVIKEVMRLHPVAPFLIPREAMEECVIGNFKIKPNTHIYVNTWAIGRNSDAWVNALEFLPERFEKKNVDLRGQYFDFLPFGMGRRKCPGWALGIANVHLMLATLAQSFTWKCQGGSIEGPLDMSEKFGLTVDMEKPLNAIVTPRLPIHLH